MFLQTFQQHKFTQQDKNVCFRDQKLQALNSKYALLTRELDKNKKLEVLLQPKGIKTYEVPLIKHVDGPDRQTLEVVISEQEFAWVVLTSPEAAKVFLQVWKQACQPMMKVACVGGGTEKELRALIKDTKKLNVAFVPSKADGETLACELPLALSNGSKQTVLYPSSLKASTTIQDILTMRGFEVYRYNTYSTESIKDLDGLQKQIAQEAPLITIGSPSALRSYINIFGKDLIKNKLVVCIGETSAKAAWKQGLKDNVFYSKNPGLEQWAEQVALAYEQI